MEIILEIVNAYGLEVLKAVLILLSGTLALIACKLFTRYANTETKRTVARIAAQFAEQVWKDLHGADKMGKALEAAETLLAKNGVKFDADEMRLLIEAAVGEFNNVFSKYIEGELLVADGVDVDTLTDEQLRELMKQLGYAYADNMTREEIMAALDEEAARR